MGNLPQLTGRSQPDIFQAVALPVLITMREARELREIFGLEMTYPVQPHSTPKRTATLVVKWTGRLGRPSGISILYKTPNVRLNGKEKVSTTSVGCLWISDICVTFGNSQRYHYC
jgi:hypothetical protein